MFQMINNNNDSKLEVVNAYKDALKFTRDLNEQGTVDLLSRILKIEEGHVSWVNTQRVQIQQMGMESYLENQTEYQLVS